jgi:uncharacterized membrane protein HdeD (DUF308 family)
VVAGVIDIIGAFLSPGSVRRAWDILSGLVSILAGAFLLLYTEFSLRALVVFVASWLIVAGVIAIVASFRLRSTRAASW